MRRYCQNNRMMNVDNNIRQIIIICQITLPHLHEEREDVMSTNNSGTNTTEVPQAKEALNRFKMEVASELGVPLKEGYNGDLTSKQAGSVGGEMVRQMIKRQEEMMK